MIPASARPLPRTVAALRDWDGSDLPDEAAYSAAVEDLKAAKERNVVALLAKRLNYEIPGVRSKVIGSANSAAGFTAGPYKEQLIAANKMWGDRLIWTKIKQSGHALTDYYLLRSLDLQRDANGSIQPVDKSQAIYVAVLGRTFYISALVTLITLALAYPVAMILAHAPPKIANILLIFILIPFWTSLLVRTTAWFVLLQDNGSVNDLIQYLHLADAPLKLIFSRFGTVIAMVHIQLPFTLLPIYSVMKGISPSYLRAARSLGRRPLLFVLPRLPATQPSGHWRRLPSDLHSLSRLLHHAGTGGRRQRPDGERCHRLSDEP